MTKDDFFTKAVKQRQGIQKDFYYFKWIHHEDEVAKERTFLIGDVDMVEGKTVQLGWHITQNEVSTLDEHNKEMMKFYGFKSTVNVNVQVFENYKISGEKQGSTVLEKLEEEEIYDKNDRYHKGVYTSRFLAVKRMLEQFWKENNDWLKNIYVR